MLQRYAGQEDDSNGPMSAFVRQQQEYKAQRDKNIKEIVLGTLMTSIMSAITLS